MGRRAESTTWSQKTCPREEETFLRGKEDVLLIELCTGQAGCLNSVYSLVDVAHPERIGFFLFV